MKILRSLAWLGGAVVLACSAPADQGRPRIIMITHELSADTFWRPVRNGAITGAAATQSELDYRFIGTFDMGHMASMIADAVASKPDGLVLTIPDAARLGDAIKAATAAGIPTIAINAGAASANPLGCLMFIGTDEESAGNSAGRRLKASGAHQVLILNQDPGNVSMTLRIRGFKDGFEGPFHHVEVLELGMIGDRWQSVVASYLQDKNELDGVMALGPVAAEPALLAIRQVNQHRRIILATFDLSPGVIRALETREIAFAIDQQPWLQGYLPVIYLANLVRSGVIIRNERVLTGPSFVTPENVVQRAKLTGN